MASLDDVTELLANWNEGSKEALDRLMPVVAAELRSRAQTFLNRERAGHTLQPTALVNEVYLRLLDRRQASWESRVHFFAFASRLMRRILVDHARSREAEKRGGNPQSVTLAEDMLLDDGPKVEVLALDQALTRLSSFDADLAEVVELRFFGGLSIQETATVLGLGDATVVRRWASARAWLYGQLAGEG